mmetsp:Transcript_1778/g.2556  ORF Transcript_1778/g.2556 Transcript_1778/m.2556 type:complete len:560 (-) Transcript_1778:149-1828(-)|eukprot:CAMPEP_0184866940 /NCGR_PEP_ID=MMETSP0580-20130426/24343_1 /TAXON_ID=1118495 /ORGANISM="Dactyliosolen fragilissimus" /LENGTH=559 /DNA_ID=CAMNT_0027366893 /DNA_START=58 /DNA_END=1737 /DNA_ORIENTATION=+
MYRGDSITSHYKPLPQGEFIGNGNIRNATESKDGIGSNGQDKIFHAEDTPAYRVLQEYNLLTTSFRKDSYEEIFNEYDFDPNSTKSANCLMSTGCCFVLPFIGSIVYHMTRQEAVVPPGHVQCITTDSNGYLFLKPGVHNLEKLFTRIESRKTLNIIEDGTFVSHGNRTVVTVPQGMLGYASDMGQPVLLPPGLHSWTSDTLRFKVMHKLDDSVIRLGPYTIVTVDEGYAAITQNNGQQVILDGGQTHLLNHQKWKFEKFITLKIQTDDLENIKAASADNVIMSVDSSVVWRIANVKLAAITAAETMPQVSNHQQQHQGSHVTSANITKLRRDVLKQAIASLAGFIGSVNYSDSFHVAAAAQRKMDVATAVAIDENEDQLRHNQQQLQKTDDRRNENPMFDMEGMSHAVAHANQITNKFGVDIISINIISANPVDKQLTSSLATGAVASAEALQAETQARGLAKATCIRVEADALALQIQAESEAKATLVRAEAEAKAQVLMAEGTKKAAALIEDSKLAVSLETIKASATAIQPSDKFFFGQEPTYMPNIVSRLIDGKE